MISEGSCDTGNSCVISNSNDVENSAFKLHFKILLFVIFFIYKIKQPW